MWTLLRVGGIREAGQETPDAKRRRIGPTVFPFPRAEGPREGWAPTINPCGWVAVLVVLLIISRLNVKYIEWTE